MPLQYIRWVEDWPPIAHTAVDDSFGRFGALFGPRLTKRSGPGPVLPPTLTPAATQRSTCRRADR